MDYKQQPPADFKRTMDYKGDQIAKSQKAKEDSIRIASSGRDAVLITTTFYKPSIFKKSMTDEEVKSKILEWRSWLFKEVYNDNISVPF